MPGCPQIIACRWLPPASWQPRKALSKARKDHPPKSQLRVCRQEPEWTAGVPHPAARYCPQPPSHPARRDPSLGPLRGSAPPDQTQRRPAADPGVTHLAGLSFTEHRGSYCLVLEPQQRSSQVPLTPGPVLRRGGESSPDPDSVQGTSQCSGL